MFNFFNGYILYPALEKLSQRKIQDKLNDLIQFSHLNREAQQKSQQKYFYEFLKYCQAQVPYYTQIFKESQFDPELLLKDIKYIQKIPLLTKEIIKERLHDIRRVDSVHPRKTGGSTGQSVHFFYNNEGLDWTAAINLYCYEMAGKKKHHRDCHIGADIDLKPARFKDQMKQKLKLFSQNRTAVLIKSFSDQNLGELLKNIQKTKPYLVQGHPSTLYAIANYIKKYNIVFDKPLFHIFEPSGEMLSLNMVQAIEKYTLCQVVNRYGNAEFGVVAHSRKQDSFQTLQVFDRAFYVEEGTEAEMIISNFTNTGMPLLRYNTGDIATTFTNEEGTFIQNITGRIHDTVELSGVNYPTHYIMDYLDHKVGGISQFQIILKDQEKPVLNLIVVQPEERRRIKEKIQQKWNSAFDIQFVEFENLIQTGWRQKFRYVVDLRDKNEK